MNEEARPQAEPEQPTARGGLAWLREGARVLALRSPRWDGLDARPLTVAVLVLAGMLLMFALQRALVEEPAQLMWTGLLGGWVDIAVIGWLCWVVARSAAAGPSAATLLALLWSAAFLLAAVQGLVELALRTHWGSMSDWPAGLEWASWALGLAWWVLVQVRLLWRVAGRAVVRAGVLLLVPVPLLVGTWLAPTAFWWTEPPAPVDAEKQAGLPLTDEILSSQTVLLARELDALRPPQPGRVNLYGLTYAPYASEDVFMRESALVAKTMRERFGAPVVELVINPATSTTLPWATPSNLRKTLRHLASVMDRDRDVLFLHLTSHGGGDGKLATNSWPLETQPLTPALLRQWLDEAGVRWRVISVSACYSGSWIEPLAGDGTLVMTAADAEHTSYGCGKRSELTFFGRAMFDEELRKTWSFTEAHAAARKVIEQREQEAGKSDGYSNPQLSEGAGIRAVLARVEAQQRGR